MGKDTLMALIQSQVIPSGWYVVGTLHSEWILLLDYYHSQFDGCTHKG